MNSINNSWLKTGFVTEPLNENIDFKNEILKLKSEKNVLIMAHYYQNDEIQDIADIIGDSLALAQKAVNTNADIILLCGVQFMGETAKLLNPGKKVLIPDLNAGCSLADSCNPEEFKQFISSHPDHVVVTYVNTTAAVKALSDVVVTSSNAKMIIDSFPVDQKIIFGPDRNLGNYLNSLTGRNMLLWDGACHVHEKFSLERILALKSNDPGIELICHPECKKNVVLASDFVGSTAALLSYVGKSDKSKFIVATESGILHQMKKLHPNKTFVPAPPNDSTCACNDCEFMKLNSLKKILLTLKYEWPEVQVDSDIFERAAKPIYRMLEITQKGQV
ncbi:MAG: quinolinate synthase NadA [Breznakibacter sp.]